MGPQGSGKSTQASLLAQDLGLPYVQTGEILRIISLLDDSNTATLIKNAVDNGKLVPTEIVTQIINKRLTQPDCIRGFVMDSYLRNQDQFRELQAKLDKVFYVRLSDEEGIKRLIKRGRADDTREVIAKRLSIYHQETEPLLTTFQDKGILEEVDGERSIKDVHDDILKRLGSHDIH